MSSQQSSSARKRPADEELTEKRDGPSFVPRVSFDLTNLDYSNLGDDAMPGDENLFSYNNDYTHYGESSTPFEFINFDDVAGMEPEQSYLGTSLASQPVTLPTAVTDADNHAVAPAVPNLTEDANTHINAPVFMAGEEDLLAGEAVPAPAAGLERRESITGPKEDEWDRRKDLIELLYAVEGLTLPSVMKIMNTAGFLKGASEKMYKIRFRKWNIVKNERPKARRQAKSNDVLLTADNVHLKGIIEAVQLICESHLQGIHGTKWAVDDQYSCTEDEWDDPFANIIWFIKQVEKSAQSSSDLPKIEDIRDDLKPVVEALGLFSLPTILTLVFRMYDSLKDTDIVSQTVADFLLECQKLAEAAGTPRHEHLVKVLKHVHCSFKEDRESLQSLIEVTISFYIGIISTYSQVESITVLSLISFYLVYVNPEDWRLNATLTKIERLLKRSEKDNGRNADATLAILRLALFILQKMEDKQKLWSYCSNMNGRINERRKECRDGTMEGKLLEDYLDVTHLFAKLNKEMGSDIGDREALRLMEEYKSTEQSNKVKNDGYDKILEDQLEELKVKLESSSIS